jgi:hypothetical protein
MAVEQPDGRGAVRWPKIYLVTDSRRLIYVGATIQRMATRLRQARTADGTHGYSGYRWMRVGAEFSLDFY